MILGTKLIRLMLAPVLVGGLVAACGMDTSFTLLKACNGDPSHQARVHMRIGGADEESVLSPGSCATALSAIAETNGHPITYEVTAADAQFYLARVKERHDALKAAIAAGGAPDKLWQDLAAVQSQLLTTADSSAGTTCAGDLDVGDFVSVAISVAGDKWNCGGVVLVTPSPSPVPTPKGSSTGAP